MRLRRQTKKEQFIKEVIIALLVQPDQTYPATDGDAYGAVTLGWFNGKVAFEWKTSFAKMIYKTKSPKTGKIVSVIDSLQVHYWIDHEARRFNTGDDTDYNCQQFIVRGRSCRYIRHALAKLVYANGVQNNPEINIICNSDPKSPASYHL